jgi:aryl-alcohol dehydrogenase-like predicted oxidoreductase
MLGLKESRRNMFGFTEQKLKDTKPLIDLLEKTAQHHNASCSQISLAWLVQFQSEQIFAIPGASSLTQAQDNARDLKVKLSLDERDSDDYGPAATLKSCSTSMGRKSSAPAVVRCSLSL